MVANAGRAERMGRVSAVAEAASPTGGAREDVEGRALPEITPGAAPRGLSSAECGEEASSVVRTIACFDASGATDAQNKASATGAWIKLKHSSRASWSAGPGGVSAVAFARGPRRCAFYATRQERCERFDDEDFTSTERCCTCGGGSTGPACGIGSGDRSGVPRR